MSGPADLGMVGPDDQEARGWLAALRTGSPDEKAQARRRLAEIFEARGMASEAAEMLNANARAGYRDAELFQTLARLYRQLGDEYLSASAAIEATRLSGRQPSRVPTGSQPTGDSGSGRPIRAEDGGRSPGHDPAQAVHPPGRGPARDADRPRAGQARDAHQPGSGHARDAHQPNYGPAGDSHRTDIGTGPSPAPVSPPAGSSRREEPARPSPWRLPLRVAGWITVLATAVAGAVVSAQHPTSAVLYLASAAALGVLLLGTGPARHLVRLPDGPLGDGALLFLWLLALLTAGALLPRPLAATPAQDRPPEATTPGVVRTPSPSPAASPAPATIPASPATP